MELGETPNSLHHECGGSSRLQCRRHFASQKSLRRFLLGEEIKVPAGQIEMLISHQFCHHSRLVRVNHKCSYRRPEGAETSTSGWLERHENEGKSGENDKSKGGGPLNAKVNGILKGDNDQFYYFLTTIF